MNPNRDFKLERNQPNLNISKQSLNMQMCPDQSTRRGHPRKASHARAKNIFDEHSRHFDDFCEKGSEYVHRSRSRRNANKSAHVKVKNGEMGSKMQSRSISERAQQYPKTNKNWMSRSQVQGNSESGKLRQIKKMMEQIAGNNHRNSRLISDLLRNVDGSTEEKPREHIFNSDRSSAKTHNIYRTQSFSRYEVRPPGEDGQFQRKGSRMKVLTEGDARTEQSGLHQGQKRKSSSMRAKMGKRFTFSVPKHANVQSEIDGFRSLFFQNKNRKRFLSSNMNQANGAEVRAKEGIGGLGEDRRSEGFQVKSKRMHKTRSHERASDNRLGLSESSEDFAMTYESEASKAEEDRLSSDNEPNREKSGQGRANRRVSFSGKAKLIKFGMEEELLQTIKSKKESVASKRENRAEKVSKKAKKPKKERAKLKQTVEENERKEKGESKQEHFMESMLRLQKKVVENHDKLNKIIWEMQKEREEEKQGEKEKDEQKERKREEELREKVGKLEARIREMEKEKQEIEAQKMEIATQLEKMKKEREKEKEKEKQRNLEKKTQLKLENKAQIFKQSGLVKKLKKEVEQLKEENTIFKAMNKVFKEQLEEKNEMIRFSMSIKNEKPESKWNFYKTDNFNANPPIQNDWRDHLRAKMTNIHQIKRKRSKLRNQSFKDPTSTDLRRSHVNLAEQSWHSRGFSNPDFLRNVDFSRERNIYDLGRSELNLKKASDENKFNSVKNLKRFNRFTLSPAKLPIEQRIWNKRSSREHPLLSAYERETRLTGNLTPIMFENGTHGTESQQNFSFQNQSNFCTPKIQKIQPQENRRKLFGKNILDRKNNGHFFSKQTSRRNSLGKARAKQNNKRRLMQKMKRPEQDTRNHIQKKTVTFALRHSSPAKQTNIYKQQIYMQKARNPKENIIELNKHVNLKSKRVKQRIREIKKANRMSNSGANSSGLMARKVLRKKRKKKSKSKSKDGVKYKTFVSFKNFTKPKKKLRRFGVNTGNSKSSYSGFSRKMVGKKISQSNFNKM